MVLRMASIDMQNNKDSAIVLDLVESFFFNIIPDLHVLKEIIFIVRSAVHGGSCQRCVIDNTSVILASGSGADAIVTPELVNFGKIFGFTFLAHAIFHSNRKGKIERPFHYIENNFLAGREFTDWQDLNQSSVHWCTTYANKKKEIVREKALRLFYSRKALFMPIARNTSSRL